MMHKWIVQKIVYLFEAISRNLKKNQYLVTRIWELYFLNHIYISRPLHAFTFGALSAIAGTSILYFMVNPLTAFLGATNFFLYTAMYTPLKRLSVLNTWV